jgi:hypothetical protein
VDEDDFCVVVSGKVEGPFSRSEIDDLHGAQIITGNTKCRRSDETQWSTVDDLVPTAKWVTCPRKLPRLSGQARSAPGLASSQNSVAGRCILAGWICAAITALTAWCMITPTLMAVPTAGVFAATVGIILGEVKKGIIVIMAIVVIAIAWPAIQWGLFARDAENQLDRMNREVEQKLQRLNDAMPKF